MFKVSSQSLEACISVHLQTWGHDSVLLLKLVCSVFVADFLKVWQSSEDCDLHEEQLVMALIL